MSGQVLNIDSVTIVMSFNNAGKIQEDGVSIYSTFQFIWHGDTSYILVKIEL